MTTEIIGALIGGLCVAIPSVIATVTSNKKSSAIMLYRVEQLEKKQDKHNSIIERTYRLEEDVKHLQEEIRRR